MRVVCLFVGIVVMAGLGCDDSVIEHLLRGRGERDQGGPVVVASPPDAGAGGGTTDRGGAPDGAAGAGGQGAAPGVACGPLSLSATIALAPAAAGQNYVRCQTLGPETGWQVTLSPSGDRLAARTGAGTLRLLATDTWTELAQLGSPLGMIDAVAFSPDGATLATLSGEMGEVALWSAHDGAFERSFAGPTASGVDTSAAALAFSSDGGRLATSLGTVIDLDSGATTSWLTGAPQAAALAVNPENLRFSAVGGSVTLLRFTGGNTELMVETDYQVGNSPTSTRLELRDPASGAQIILYNFYSRGLLGYAISSDGRTVAWATTAEAGAQGFAAGLALFDAASGTQQAFDPSFAGTITGFSRDGAELFVETGTTVSAVDAADLHPISHFTAPAGVTFLGVSPGNELVGSVSGTTTWWNAASGAIVRTSSYPLTAATWSGDGRFGAGSGDPAALFHLWRESDDGQLCAPAADRTSAPALTSLGTPGPTAENQSATSSDGSVTVTSKPVIHTHATNYDALSVTASATGALLRQFGAMNGTQPSAISNPAGDRLFTSQGADVAVWCR
jgi:WD40 repeat protein